MELLNVIMLYLKPDTRKGNGMGVFRAYDASRQDPAVFAFVTYLINWVAGTKLIFIVLLIGIIIAGDATIKVFSIIALIFSISTFYTRLYPTIKQMDSEGTIVPAGYSKTLGIIIGSFLGVFAVALVVFIVQNV